MEDSLRWSWASFFSNCRNFVASASGHLLAVELLLELPELRRVRLGAPAGGQLRGEVFIECLQLGLQGDHARVGAILRE